MVEGLTQAEDVVAWIEAAEVRVLNVAGHRESTEPGIGERAERFLVDVFGRLAQASVPGAPKARPHVRARPFPIQNS